MVPLVSTGQPLASVQQKSNQNPKKTDLANPEDDCVLQRQLSGRRIDAKHCYTQEILQCGVSPLTACNSNTCLDGWVVEGWVFYAMCRGLHTRNPSIHHERV